MNHAHSRTASSARLRWRAVAASGVAVATAALGLTAVPAVAKAKPQPNIAAAQWTDCPSGWGNAPSPEDIGLTLNYSCTTVKVPMDYDNPGGAQVNIAARRIAAGDPAHKIGTLFFNPGGPGGSGVSLMDYAWSLVSPEVRAKFDLVGFDPRGIARSDGLVCFSSFQEARRTYMTIPEPFPITIEEKNAIQAGNATVSAKCGANGGELLNHLSTANVARDLDSLRQAVGDKQLSYIGFSYGTAIGAAYSAMFPGNVRAVVVDGVVDPVQWTTGRSQADKALPMTTRLGSDVGTWKVLQQFFDLCRQVGVDMCPLKAQGDPEQVYAKLAASLRKEPVRIALGGGDVIELTYQDLVMVTTSIMYGPYGWDALAYIIAAAAESAGVAKPVPAPVMAKAKTGLRAYSGAPMTTTGEGALGVICEDATYSTDPDLWWNAGRAADKRSRYFGSPWTWMSQGCATWKGKDTDRYAGPWNKTTANPVLVIGNSYDPATPYAGAVAFNRLFPNSRLLTYAGWGHLAAPLNVCANNYANAYVLTGALPAAGTVCTPDYLPFTPIPDSGSSTKSTSTVAKATMKAKVAAQQMITKAALSGGVR